MTRLREQESSMVTPHIGWRPVSFADVTIDDQFWAPRLRLNRERTIPFQYRQLRETGRLDALRLDWRPGQEPVPHIFWDSDVAKWIEAASYSLATHPDPALDALVDDTIALLASAQQPDGYLNTYFTVVKPGQRWTDLRDAHELYCAGHLIEAGVAHYEATGKRALLDVVCRYADYIDTVFGTAPGQKRGYCGHEEIELALVKLYHATGEERYLRLAQYFVDERGRRPYYFDLEAERRGSPGYFESHLAAGDLRRSRAYNQSHAPVREQDEVVGHAVRAMYLYCAMADLASETGDETLRATCRRLWDHLTTRRMYITGGIGSSAQNEGFTRDYDLPTETAYAETCAAIGLVFWASRMARLERDGRYVDVLERALYNGVISGVSHDGTRFFYDNPLASDGSAHRQEWFGVACCPPNLARLLASLGQYIYAHSDAEVVVHLYVQSTGRFQLGDQAVTIRQETAYPWDGKVTLRFELERAAVFALRLRLPGWNRVATLTVNDEAVDVTSSVEKGYITIEREWSQTDTVQLDLAMPVERVYANPKVSQAVGRVALQRGPLVYCLEEVDNAVSTRQVVLPTDAAVTASLNAAELGGLVVVHGAVDFADAQGWDGALYRTGGVTLAPIRMTAIPYYAWDNRRPGDMCVWIHERQGALHEPEAT
jgi:DUF1680 family protein